MSRTTRSDIERLCSPSNVDLISTEPRIAVSLRCGVRVNINRSKPLCASTLHQRCAETHAVAKKARLGNH